MKKVIFACILTGAVAFSSIAANTDFNGDKKKRKGKKECCASESKCGEKKAEKTTEEKAK